MHNDLFWNLFAKNLAGEASEREMEELTMLLKANPGLSYPAQNVADIWKLDQPDQTKEAEKAYQLHLSRMITKHLINPFDQAKHKPSNLQIAKKKWPRILRMIFLATILIILGFILAADGKTAINKCHPNWVEAVYELS